MFLQHVPINSSQEGEIAIMKRYMEFHQIIDSFLAGDDGVPHRNGNEELEQNSTEEKLRQAFVHAYDRSPI